jgi:hypothetical protein
MKTLPKVAILVLAVAAVLVYGWSFVKFGPSAASLADKAMHGDTEFDRQAAAVQLGRLGPKGAEYVHRLVKEGPDTSVRVACIQAIRTQQEYGGVTVLIDALDDPAPLVREQASRTLNKMLRRDLHFPLKGDASQRQQATTRIRKLWEDLTRWELVDALKQNKWLTYFYDRKKGEVFEAPGDSPPKIPTASGPYEGEPAGVRAAVFTLDPADDPSKRFVGWLELPPPPVKKDEKQTEVLKICRPGENQWFEEDSDGANGIIQSVYGQGQVKRCQPQG